MTERPSIKDRAGTQLDHRFTKTITLNGKTIGKLDDSQGIYQFGGRRTSFVLWKLRLLGLGKDEWALILQEGADTLEFVESERNECWRISVDEAIRYGQPYNVGYGEKFGIPIDRFQIFDVEGNSV